MAENQKPPSMTEQRMAAIEKLKRAPPLPRFKDGCKLAMHVEAVSEGEKAPSKEEKVTSEEEKSRNETKLNHGEKTMKLNLEADTELEKRPLSPTAVFKKRRSRSRSRSRSSKHLKLKFKDLQSPVPQIAGASSQDENLSVPIPIMLSTFPPLLSPVLHFPILQQSRFVRFPAPATSDISPFYPYTSPSTPLPTLQDLQEGLMRSNSAGSSSVVGQRMATYLPTDDTETNYPWSSLTSPPYLPKISQNNTVSRSERIIARQNMLNRLQNRITKGTDAESGRGTEDRDAAFPIPKRRGRRTRRTSTTTIPNLTGSDSDLDFTNLNPQAVLSTPLPTFQNNYTELRVQSTSPNSQNHTSKRISEGMTPPPPLPTHHAFDEVSKGQGQTRRITALIEESDDDDREKSPAQKYNYQPRTPQYDFRENLRAHNTSPTLSNNSIDSWVASCIEGIVDRWPLPPGYSGWEDYDKYSAADSSEYESSASPWEQAKNMFSEAESSTSRRSRANRIAMHERRDYTDSSISQKSGASITSRTTDKGDSLGPSAHVQVQASQLMQTLSALDSVLSLAPQLPLKGSTSPIPPSVSVNVSKVPNAKLFPFPGMLKLEEVRRAKGLTNPDVPIQSNAREYVQDSPKDNKASAQKLRNLDISMPSLRDDKGKGHLHESFGSPFSGKITQRQVTQRSEGFTSSKVEGAYHSRRVHTATLSHLSPSSSPSTQQPLRGAVNVPTAKVPSLHRLSKDNRKSNSPQDMAHSLLRGVQEGWSTPDDLGVAETLHKLDGLAGQHAHLKVHRFVRPSTASSRPGSPADRTNRQREVVNTSNSGKSKHSSGSHGSRGLKDSPLYPHRKSSPVDLQTSLPLSLQGPRSEVSTDGSVEMLTQYVNSVKTLDRATHSTHPVTAIPSASANLPLPALKGLAHGLTSSAHRNHSESLTSSSIPFFRRSSSQSLQIPPASGTSFSVSQNTLSTNELQLPGGPSTHNGGPSINLAPPANSMFSSKIAQKAKHRLSLAPLPVRQGNGDTNTTRGGPPASSPPYAPHTADDTAPRFLPRVRRGYWNRRGDHLTPDRYIVYAPPALAYPAELVAYPLEEEGYQNEEGVFLPYTERPELSASLPRKGKAPVTPYESFVVYVNDESRRSLAPHWSSIDPFPRGRTPPKHNNKRSSHKKSPTTTTKQELKDEARSLSKDLPRVADPWDLDTRLAALGSRRPISPTSSSSSYGSAHSTRSRASSFSGSAGGHIPGTNRDVIEFPFASPIPN